MPKQAREVNRPPPAFQGGRLPHPGAAFQGHGPSLGMPPKAPGGGCFCGVGCKAAGRVSKPMARRQGPHPRQAIPRGSCRAHRHKRQAMPSAQRRAFPCQGKPILDGLQVEPLQGLNLFKAKCIKAERLAESRRRKKREAKHPRMHPFILYCPRGTLGTFCLVAQERVNPSLHIKTSFSCNWGTLCRFVFVYNVTRCPP